MDVMVKGAILLACDIDDLHVGRIKKMGYMLLYIVRGDEPELMICTKDLERDVFYDVQKMGIFVQRSSIFKQSVVIKSLNEKILH